MSVTKLDVRFATKNDSEWKRSGSFYFSVHASEPQINVITRAIPPRHEGRIAIVTNVAESPTVLYELTAQKLYKFYKNDVYGCVIVMQNINRELCRRLRRADDRFAEPQMLQTS